LMDLILLLLRMMRFLSNLGWVRFLHLVSMVKKLNNSSNGNPG
jgi:hypothetical protein